MRAVKDINFTRNNNSRNSNLSNPQSNELNHTSHTNHTSHNHTNQSNQINQINQITQTTQNGKLNNLNPQLHPQLNLQRNISTNQIMSNMIVDNNLRMNIHPMQHNSNMRNQSNQYVINQQNNNSGVVFNRNDNRFPIDQSKNSLNKPQYLRANLLPNMPHQGYTNYGFYNNKRKRRERTSFTKTQLSVLLETYAVQPYPDVQQRLDIAARIGLDESRVQVWFKNRRAKERKDELVANSIRTGNNIHQTSQTMYNNQSQHHNGQDPSQNHHRIQNDQFINNQSNTRYQSNMHLSGQTPFAELFGVPAFADENDVINQYVDLLPNNQQDNNPNAFSMNPSALGISKEEAELLISSSPGLPKLQPLKQNYQDQHPKQH